MKTPWILALLISICLAISLIVVTCGDDDDDDDDAVEVSGDIGPDGGTVEVTDESSPIFGTYIEIPAGALDETIEISISTGDQPPQPELGNAASYPVRFEPEGYVFLKPFFFGINIPSEAGDIEPDIVGIFHFNEVLNKWQYATFLGQRKNEERRVISASAVHFSTYQAYYIDNVLDIDTGFSPSPDGFAISNFSDEFLWWGDGGHCMGMSAFSKWFFDNITNQSTCSALQDSYSESQQKQIADQAHQQTPHQASWETIIDAFATSWPTEYDYSNEVSFNQLITALMVEQSPIIIIAGDDSKPEHVFLVFRFVDFAGGNEGDFWVYEPGSPDLKRILTYSVSDKQFSYEPGDYTKFVPASQPSWYTSDFFDELLEEYPCSSSDDDVNDDDVDDDNDDDDDSEYYAYERNGKGWQVAQDYCESLGGYLVTITSSSENEDVTDLLDSEFPGWVGSFIGLTDQDEEDNFQWVTGEYLSYENWAPDQPDNYEDADIVQILGTSISGPLGTWDDTNDGNSDIDTFVCEVD